MANHYRPDIDGLRTIAVMAVVLYHAGAAAFPGGFVGVDVFFVISGFLIAGIIRDEVKAGTWQLTGFYYRRLYRILPPLFVVLLATLCIGYFLLFPADFRALAKQTGYSLVFWVNMYFRADQAGYFHSAAELQPLLHLWSLSVEEQFYLFWPLLTILAVRKNAEAGLLAGIGLLSFALSCWLLWSGNQNTAFFTLPSRAWELAIGAAISMACSGRTGALLGRFSNLASVAGLAMIFAAVLFLDRHASFPGWNALLPTLGTGLLILAGPDAWVNRYLLSRSAMVALGLRSYSLYLWHWPLLAYVRVIHIGDLPGPWAAAMVVLAMVAASLTYSLVEHPVRSWARNRIKQGHRAVGIANWWPVWAMVLLPASAALHIYANHGLVTRFPKSVLDDLSGGEQVKNWGECEASVVDRRLHWSDRCVFQEGARLVVVWGDSHAEHYLPGLAAYERTHGRIPVLLSTPSCPPLPTVERIDDSRRCADIARTGFEWMRSDSRVEKVYIAGRFAAYGDGMPLGFDRSAPVRLVAMDGHAESDQKALFRHALGEVVQGLTGSGKRVVVLGEVPQQLMDVPSCEGRKKYYGRYFASAECDLPRRVYEAREGWLNDYLLTLEQNTPGVCVFHPENFLCDREACRVRANGQIVYSDNNHLNPYGAAWLAGHFNRSACFP